MFFDDEQQAPAEEGAEEATPAEETPTAPEETPAEESDETAA